MMCMVFEEEEKEEEEEEKEEENKDEEVELIDTIEDEQPVMVAECVEMKDACTGIGGYFVTSTEEESSGWEEYEYYESSDTETTESSESQVDEERLL
ncbi:histone H3.v1-like [Erinaceus europaeus]|uniref:Histone H3.v1-like n=1 Tax=Erinaceus europaeus TaxID=9365 RepID=A0ABM3XX89_ERIEU|nr:histone H3.v1-like [Erinaceus europaeus]